MTETQLRLRREMPHFRAMCRDGQAWALSMDGFESCCEAWMAGKPFWSGMTIWGEAIDIKLADVVGITFWTEETIALVEEEAAEVKRRELTS